MKVKIMLDKTAGAIMPTRAHETDAGLDLYTPRDITIPKGEYLIVKYGEQLIDGGVQIGSATIDTGVHIEIPRGYVGFVKSKSGLMVKSGITTDGTIDCGYTGSICVKLFNHTKNDHTFKKGDKIAQLVLLPIITPDLELVDSLDETERGDNGFGSTGR